MRSQFSQREGGGVIWRYLTYVLITLSDGRIYVAHALKGHDSATTAPLNWEMT